MTHSHSTKYGKKRYRYYICINAQKRGWHTCPSKSVPAPEIERFVVDQIRGIAADPGLIAETLAQARQQVETVLERLDGERRGLQRDLTRAGKELRTLLAEIAHGANGGPSGPTTGRLADIQEQIRLAEKRLAEIRDEEAVLRAESITEDEVAAALHDFDGMWASLSPREQARVIELLVERVAYDGAASNVSVTFRPSGIRALASELQLEETAA